MNLLNVSVLICMSLLSLTTLAVPGSFTYQGRIKNSEGLPLEINGVIFEFSIMNPSGSCLLFRETSSAIDMRNSNGVFDIAIGIGTKGYPSDTGHKLLDSFDNDITHNCEGGGTYSPLVDDKRLLRVQFFDGTGWKLITPDNEIRSVPFAAHAKVAQTAQKLGNNIAMDFTLKSDIPLCGAGQYLRHIAPMGAFECTSPTVNGFTGNLVGDVSGPQSATSVEKIKGVALDMTGIASGKVLKYDGTSWAPADDTGTAGALTGLTGDVTSTGSPTAIVTLSNGSVSTNKIADGTIVNADISGSAAIADTKLATISTAGKVSGNAITSGTIGGSTEINTSGAVAASSVRFPDSTTQTTAAQMPWILTNNNFSPMTITTNTAPSFASYATLNWTAPKTGKILVTFTPITPFVFSGCAAGNLGFSIQFNGSQGTTFAHRFITNIVRFASGVGGDIPFTPIVEIFNVTSGTAYTVSLMYFSQSFSSCTVNLRGNSGGSDMVKIEYVN